MSLPDPDAPMCTSGKRPFRTEDEALTQLRNAQRLRRDQHTGYRPDSVEESAYQCGACLWWHLTSSSKARRRGELGNRGRRRK